MTDLAAHHRSWMIGLAGHGIAALREVDGLWSYVERVGVRLDALSIFLGRKEVRQSVDDADSLPAHVGDAAEAKAKAKAAAEGYLVDRNYVVAACAQFLGRHLWRRRFVQTQISSQGALRR